MEQEQNTQEKEQELTPEQKEQYSILEPLKGRDRSEFMRRALAIQRLIEDFGQTQQQIARRVGCTQPTIQYHYKIARYLIPELQELALEKKIAYTAALLLSDMSEERQQEFLEGDRGRGDRITHKLVKAAKKEKESQALSALSMRRDLPDQPTGLFLHFSQMEELLAQGELTVNWQGQEFDLTVNLYN